VTRTAEEAAQEQLEAYNARDLEAFLRPYAEDALLMRLPGEEVVAHGHEAMRRIYRKLFAESPDLHCHLLGRILQGRFVVDHEKVSGLRGGESAHAVAIYEVSGGFIRRVWFLKQAE
jgi:hypothetical protein